MQAFPRAWPGSGPPDLVGRELFPAAPQALGSCLSGPSGGVSVAAAGPEVEIAGAERTPGPRTSPPTLSFLRVDRSQHPLKLPLGLTGLFVCSTGP